MSESIEMQFDAFCKKVIQHACLDTHAELHRRASLEQPLELAYNIPAEPDKAAYGRTWMQNPVTRRLRRRYSPTMRHASGIGQRGMKGHAE